MIWEIAAIIATVLLFLALGYLYYSGLFYPVHIVIRKPYEGSLPIAYKYCVSNYNACGTVFQEFVSATSNETQLIGMYYDDPDDPAVDKNKCRYIVGAVLTGEGAKYRDALKERGYSFTTVPPLDKAVVCDFPMVNYLSILIAIYRVYSAMFKYMKKEGLKHESPMVELYGCKTMRVIAAFETGPGFRVPELK